MTEKIISDLIKYTIRRALLKYGLPIGIGRHRIVFRDNDYVIKIPFSWSGIHACYEELDTQGEMFAKTSMDSLFCESEGIPVVRMEYVIPTGWSEKPDWTWSIDCGQVGLTKDGRLVAYDWEDC